MDILNPKITVLMPVYNCELYIKEAIDSILNQTFTDFEFLIIDDASTDETVSIIKENKDSRIQLIEKPVNTGYTISLNYGLKVAKGEYIARMDGDDISLPERFAKQVAFLDSNPDVVLCGSNFRIIETEKIISLPEDNEAIKLGLLKGNCIAHPSVMIRHSVLQENVITYDSNKEPAEDYDLWVRLLQFGKLHNIQDNLLKYRVHATQVSKKRECQQAHSALQSRFKMLNYIDYSFNSYEYKLLEKIMQRNIDVTYSEIKEFFHLKKKMNLANSNKFFHSNGFQFYLMDLYHQKTKRYFVDRENFYPLNFYQYFAIKKSFGFSLKLKEEIKLLIKSLIFYKRK
ncbi:glycosyltransferase [Flavobacterium sp. LM5]|uniref:glycosyltransferase family 2 protein n=1 Tax=Flavobacterium sp. LM5 TaxID=1938610 RepID=UPI0009920403|nr:glycosyltransferase [Flavobacterium sp. LM5]